MNKRCYLILCGFVVVLHIVLALAYGLQKEGFHEDEYFSYWSSAGQAELTPINGYEWRSGYDIQKQFLVREDNRFAFDEVIQNQAEDVHPPLYYLALNLFMSCFAGRFYKWFGILLNLFFSVVSMIGIFYLFSRLDAGKNRYWFSLLAGMVYAVAPSTISNIMITRMYVMSAMWTVLYACVLVEIYRSSDCSKKKFAVITGCGALICYCSFLTHYFCLLEAFFLTLFYGVYVLVARRRDVLRFLIYGVSMLAAIGTAVLTFPTSLQHIFHGYRGEGAINGLLNAGLLDFTKVFLPYIDRNVFAGLLLPAAIITGAAVLFLVVRRTRQGRGTEKNVEIGGCIILLLSCIASLYVLTRTALMVGDSSCRYFFPVISLLLPTMAYVIMKGFGAERVRARNTRITIVSIVLVAVFLPLLLGHIQGNILFLYKGEEEKIEFSAENKQYPLIMIFNRDTDYRSWYTADQLWPFENIFYADYEHLMLDFKDDVLLEAEKVIIYMDCQEDVIEKLLRENTHLSSYSMVRHDPFFYVYVLE